jgi:hypothetical protein
MSAPARKALTPDQIDNLGYALIELAKELWVMKDRQIITEAILRQKGVVIDLDTYQPGPDLTAHIAAERTRFLNAFAAVLFHEGAS